MFKMFSSRHRSTLFGSNFVKFGQREIGEIVRYLPDRIKNKISDASQTVATAQIAPKICQGQSQQCTHSAFHPNRFTHFRRSYSWTREHRQI